jgi:hypothetical protein
MFLLYFVIALVVLIVAVSALLIWREHRAADYQDHLDPRDQPSAAQSAALGNAMSTSTHRAGGSAF